MRPSVAVARRLSNCGSWALERRLSSCGAWAELLRGTWDRPGPGLEPVSPSLAGGFLSTAPPGKSQGPGIFLGSSTAHVGRGKYSRTGQHWTGWIARGQGTKPRR